MSFFSVFASIFLAVSFCVCTHAQLMSKIRASAYRPYKCRKKRLYCSVTQTDILISKNETIQKEKKCNIVKKNIKKRKKSIRPVSYTHLTLPTIDSV